MTDMEKEWEARERRGRARFQRAEYTIKDQYKEPGTPFFAPSYYISSPTMQRVIVDQAFDGVPVGRAIQE